MNRLEIEKITGNVEAAARNTSWLLEYGLDRPDLVWNILRQLMENNPDHVHSGFSASADCRTDLAGLPIVAFRYNRYLSIERNKNRFSFIKST